MSERDRDDSETRNPLIRNLTEDQLRAGLEARTPLTRRLSEDQLQEINRRIENMRDLEIEVGREIDISPEDAGWYIAYRTD